MTTLWNETINAARIGLRQAILEVREFSGCSVEEALRVVLAVGCIEGVPPEHPQYAPELYEYVREALR